MDRILGAASDTTTTDHKLAESYAREVIRIGTDATGTELSPMRDAEARITLGVIAARQGDLESAVDHGNRALAGQRLSVPSLLMVSSELAPRSTAATPPPSATLTSSATCTPLATRTQLGSNQ